MIGLDTNLLLRYILADDLNQKTKVDALFHAQKTASWGYVNLVVLCELFWTLQRTYRVPRERMADMVEGLLCSTGLVFQEEECCKDALIDYREGYDFADSLIGAVNHKMGCTTTHTLDKVAASLPHFSPVHVDV